MFRVKSGFYRSTGGLPEPPGCYWAYMGPKGEEEGRPRQAARPLPPSPNRTRKGGRPPFLFLPSPFLFQQGKREESLGLLQAHP